MLASSLTRSGTCAQSLRPLEWDLHMHSINSNLLTYAIYTVRLVYISSWKEREREISDVERRRSFCRFYEHESSSHQMMTTYVAWVARERDKSFSYVVCTARTCTVRTWHCCSLSLSLADMVLKRLGFISPMAKPTQLITFLIFHYSSSSKARVCSPLRYRC